VNKRDKSDRIQWEFSWERKINGFGIIQHQLRDREIPHIVGSERSLSTTTDACQPNIPSKDVSKAVSVNFHSKRF
jgi:hypothetical protein